MELLFRWIEKITNGLFPAFLFPLNGNILANYYLLQRNRYLAQFSNGTKQTGKPILLFVAFSNRKFPIENSL